MVGKRKAPPATVPVPELDEETIYETWKDDIKRWAKITSVLPASRALTIHFSLKGKAKICSDQLPMSELDCKEGVENLLAALDKIFLPQIEYRKWRVYQKMKRIHRKPGGKISDYITEFDQLKTNYQKLNGEINDSNAAFWLLESCRLPTEKNDTIMANISGCTYEKMKDTLTRMNYRELIDEDSPTPSSSEVSVEPVIQDPINTRPDEVLYTTDKPNTSRDRGYYSSNQQSRGRGKYSGYNRRKGNPVGNRGKTLKCYICDSTRHLKHACPYMKDIQDMIDKKPGINFSMFVGCTSNQTTNNLQTLVTESKGYAILDSGCSTTVCGQVWLDSFIESLSDEDRFKIKIEPSAQTFTFGDGNTVKSKQKMTIPCWMGGVQGELSTDVVDCNIPLLLSRKSMKLVGMILDFKHDKVTVGEGGRDIRLKITKSGHYAMPLSL